MWNGKMCNNLKKADHRAKRWKFRTRGPRKSICTYVGCFSVRTFEFSLGSSGALCNFSDVKNFKRLFLPQFSSNFMENTVIRGENRLLLFLDICQILKICGTLKISYLSFIATIHKVMLVSSRKGSSRVSRTLVLLLNFKLQHTNK